MCCRGTSRRRAGPPDIRARKQKGSHNRAKARWDLARVHARIADRRRDHLHKITTRLVRENQTLVIEDLTVRNMLGNSSLAREGWNPGPSGPGGCQSDTDSAKDSAGGSSSAGQPG
ncbi:transposase [Nocardia rhamnosiphila]